MRSNFESPMELRNKRKTLEACGPVFWEGEPNPIDVRVTVRVTQGGASVEDTSGVLTLVPGVTDEWMFLMPTQKRLVAGGGTGHAKIRRAAGGDVLFEWNQPVAFMEASITEDALVEL